MTDEVIAKTKDCMDSDNRTNSGEMTSRSQKYNNFTIESLLSGSKPSHFNTLSNNIAAVTEPISVDKFKTEIGNGLCEKDAFASDAGHFNCGRGLIPDRESARTDSRCSGDKSVASDMRSGEQETIAPPDLYNNFPEGKFSVELVIR